MITIDAEAAIADLEAMVARLRAPEPLLGAIGEAEVELSRERIEETKDDPLGGGWLPWADSTSRQRVRKGTADLGLLYDTGELLESIHAAVEGNTVAIGSDVDYAIYLQDGTSKMPARPFLGWAPENLDAYESMFVRFLETGVPA